MGCFGSRAGGVSLSAKAGLPVARAVKARRVRINHWGRRMENLLVVNEPEILSQNAAGETSRRAPTFAEATTGKRGPACGRQPRPALQVRLQNESEVDRGRDGGGFAGGGESARGWVYAEDHDRVG